MSARTFSSAMKFLMSSGAGWLKLASRIAPRQTKPTDATQAIIFKGGEIFLTEMTTKEPMVQRTRIKRGQMTGELK